MNGKFDIMKLFSQQKRHVSHLREFLEQKGLLCLLNRGGDGTAPAAPATSDTSNTSSGSTSPRDNPSESSSSSSSSSSASSASSKSTTPSPLRSYPSKSGASDSSSADSRNKQKLQQIVLQQSADGFWTLTKEFSDVVLGSGVYEILLDSVPSRLTSSDDTHRKLWATVVALEYLKSYHKSSSDGWELLAGKANGWLSQVLTTTDLKLDELRETAKSFLEKNQEEEDEE